MEKNGWLGFRKGERIKIKCGAVIIPIYRTNNTGINHNALADYLMEARKPRCEFQVKCIDTLQNKNQCLGFSCEVCPHN